MMNETSRHLTEEAVETMTKSEILQLILSMMHDRTFHIELFDEAYHFIKRYLEGIKTIHEARQFALLIHKMARMNPDSHQRLLYRAWGHAVASIHVKTHIIPMFNYLNKYDDTKE